MKLTNAAREDIIARAIKATFAERDAAHQVARTVAVDALYNAIYAAEEKIAAKLPNAWSSRRDTIEVFGDGVARHSTSPGIPRNFKLSKARLFPVYIGSLNLKDGPPESHEAFNRLFVEHNAIEAAKAVLRENLVQLTYAVTTVAKLEEAWPAGVKFFPVESTKPALPVVPYSLAKTVNRLMGLAA